MKDTVSVYANGYRLHSYAYPEMFDALVECINSGGTGKDARDIVEAHLLDRAGKWEKVNRRPLKVYEDCKHDYFKLDGRRVRLDKVTGTFTYWTGCNFPPYIDGLINDYPGFGVEVLTGIDTTVNVYRRVG